MPPTSDTRQRLIDAAADLFWRRGYAATGLSDILEAAGARGGSLYHFFPTKDDLLLAVIDHHARIIETTIENTLAAHEDPAAKIPAVVDCYRSLARRGSVFVGCPLTNLAGEVVNACPQAAGRLSAVNERLVAKLAEALATVPSQAFRPTEPAQAIACMIQGAALQARAAGNDAPFDACAGAVRSLMGSGAVSSPRIMTREARLFARS